MLKNDVTTKQIKEINTFETIYIELMFNLHQWRRVVFFLGGAGILKNPLF